MCAYGLVSGLFWGKIGMDNSLICLSSILARVNYNVFNMCHAYIHYCSYNYLILILFVYMMYTIVAVCLCVCVCVCVKQESKKTHRSGGQ